MLRHKEELGFIISIFKAAITNRGYAQSGIAEIPDQRDQGRDPFRANNDEFIYGFVFIHRAYTSCISFCFS